MSGIEVFIWSVLVGSVSFIAGIIVAVNKVARNEL